MRNLHGGLLGLCWPYTHCGLKNIIKVAITRNQRDNNQSEIHYYLKMTMRPINSKKVISIVLLWLVCAQSVVFASYEIPLDTLINIHCKSQDQLLHADCCDNLVSVNSHCKSCFQPAFSTITTSRLSNIDQNPGFNQAANFHLYYSSPFLELFKPPI